MGFSYGQPVAVQAHDGSSWGWTYINPTTTGSTSYGTLSSGSGTPSGNHYEQHGFTFTVEMDKV